MEHGSVKRGANSQVTQVPQEPENTNWQLADEV